MVDITGGWGGGASSPHPTSPLGHKKVTIFGLKNSGLKRAVLDSPQPVHVHGRGGGVMQQQGKRNRQNRGVPNFSKQMNISNCLLIIQRGNGFFVLVICWAIWTVRLGRKDPVPHPHSTPLLMFFCLLTVLCIALNFMIWASKPARQSTGSFVHPEQASREGDVSTHLVKVTPPPL